MSRLDEGPPPLQFRDLSHSVIIKEKRVKRARVVLDGVSGDIERGGFLAVLGPSGAGKTTLLAIVAGDVCPSGGSVARRGTVGYAPQTDFLLPFLTVRETLLFAADLRLDRSNDYASAEARATRADALLAQFGLSVVSATKVGSQDRRGISGGERKRLSIAAELVATPAVLIADEPTSGLDSHAALATTQLLADLGRNCGTAVLASLHQPSMKMFHLFRDLLILGPGGRPCYAGPAVGAVEACVARFRVALPPQTSAPEFLLDMATEEHQQSHGDGALAPLAANVSAAVREPPFLRQCGVLLRRARASNAQSPVAMHAALGRSIVMALLVGALYSGVGLDQRGAADRAGALFFVLVNQAFAALSSLRVFVDERGVFEHERKRGAYGAPAYFLTKSAAEVPAQLAFAAVFAAISYALVGLRWDAAAFAAHVGVLALATLVAESLVLVVGAGAPDAKVAVVVGPVLLSTSLLFGGFFVNLDSLPAYLAPLQHLSLFRHAFAALLKIEYEGLAFQCSAADRDSLAQKIVAAGVPDDVVRGLTLPCPTPDGESFLLRILGPNRAAQSVATTDVPALCLLLVGFRLLAYFALTKRGRAARPPKAAKKAGAKVD